MILKICVIRTKNITVTRHNFDLFVRAFKECGFQVFETTSRKEAIANKYQYYLASDLITAFKLIRRRKKFFYWMQGIAPEESVLENKSRLHYFIWSIMEKMVIKHSLFIWTVSKEMAVFLEKKYKLFFLQKSSIFPCYNVTLHKKSFFSKDKYSDNVFVYAGGLTPWQCFEETVQIYKKIEEKYPNTSFLILARDKKKALEIASRHGIKNYAVDYVSQSELNDRLASAKFGFVIRKNHPVNNVSTPTKISSYLSNGVIPIFTSSIKDFYYLAKNNEYILQYDSPLFDKKIDNLLKKSINPQVLFDNYSFIFEEYYNDSKYIKDIKQRINKYTKQ